MTHNDGKQLDYTLTASVFLSFLGVVLVLSVVLCVKFWALRKYHPISGRSPVLALLVRRSMLVLACALSVAVLLMLRCEFRCVCVGGHACCALHRGADPQEQLQLLPVLADLLAW